MHTGAEKELGTPSHILYLHLPLQSIIPASMLFLVNESYWSPRPRILRATSGVVLFNTPANVRRVAGVQRVVCAEKDVDEVRQCEQTILGPA